MADSDSAKKQGAKLPNDLQDISFGEIGLIVLGTWLVLFVVRRTVPFLAERGPSQLRLYLLASVPIVRLVLLTVAILWILWIVFNITFQNVLVITGAASVAIGFAFKDYVSSLIAGVVAIFERPYQAGDWVCIGGDCGEVRNVGLRAISIQTSEDNTVVIPHSRLWTDNISNSNDGAKTMMSVASFYLMPRHDAAVVRSLLQDVALSSAYLDYAKPVSVVLNETPWSTHYQLRAYPFDLRDHSALVSDMTVRGKQAVFEAGAREAATRAVEAAAA